MKARNMDNDWMYHVYQNSAKGPYLLELCPLVGFQKIKIHFA